MGGNCNCYYTTTVAKLWYLAGIFCNRRELIIINLESGYKDVRAKGLKSKFRILRFLYTSHKV